MTLAPGMGALRKVSFRRCVGGCTQESGVAGQGVSGPPAAFLSVQLLAEGPRKNVSCGARSRALWLLGTVPARGRAWGWRWTSLLAPSRVLSTDASLAPQSLEPLRSLWKAGRVAALDAPIVPEEAGARVGFPASRPQTWLGSSGLLWSGRLVPTLKKRRWSFSYFCRRCPFPNL